MNSIFSSCISPTLFQINIFKVLPNITFDFNCQQISYFPDADRSCAPKFSPVFEKFDESNATVCSIRRHLSLDLLSVNKSHFAEGNSFLGVARKIAALRNACYMHAVNKRPRRIPVRRYGIIHLRLFPQFMTGDNAFRMCLMAESVARSYTAPADFVQSRSFTMNGTKRRRCNVSREVAGVHFQEFPGAVNPCRCRTSGDFKRKWRWEYDVSGDSGSLINY